ncbi:serine/threonine-protein kinase 36-like protein [Blastocystis sp. ATCC 50177/Nand II]|uniref:Serine/threonine-protein kinase 36-like protein n=1 Tax=Blastocystis sp. subtype 1 (strain ATCC 50177 / NandII) TaxID=478820 RepID=A0A196SCC8_BLAHN|nr:serine/threonine-protein kinase 36-like protein [Blastocystis sp. ATCC 50177/Nand II]
MLFPVSAVVTILDVPKHCIDIKKVNYNKKEPIGGGSYGNVYKGEYDGKTVAIKVLNASEMSDNDKSQLREIAVGASASNSKNLVTVYGYINDKSMTAIVMECGETDLEQYIKEGRFKTNKERVACLLQIASGIQQLHMQGIVDRDIKAKNVILVGNVWKLCDFGLSRYIGNDSLMLSSVGTPTFQSPENITKSICSTSMDVYSFGCLIASWTEKGLIPCLPSSVDKVLQGLVRRCCLDKYLRPSIDKIISELGNLYNIM